MFQVCYKIIHTLLQLDPVVQCGSYFHCFCKCTSLTILFVVLLSLGKGRLDLLLNKTIRTYIDYEIFKVQSDLIGVYQMIESGV